MGKSPFYIKRWEWKADQRKTRSPVLQDVFELPPAIARLDKRVKALLCKLLSSEKTSLYAALRQSVKELEVHRDLGWSLTFRATYLFAWCHDLAWFAMAPSSDPELVTVRTPFKRCCHVCASGGYGYRQPGEGFGRKWTGDVLESPPIPPGLEKAVAAVMQEVARLRTSGALDPIMKEITRTVGKLGRSVNAYIVLPILDFDRQGERVAITAGTWLTPGHLPTASEAAAKYYKPCTWCRGSGSEY